MSRAWPEAAASTRGSTGSAGRPWPARSTLMTHSSAARIAAGAAAPAGCAVAPAQSPGLAGRLGSAAVAAGTQARAKAAGASASSIAASASAARTARRCVTPPAARGRPPAWVPCMADSPLPVFGIRSGLPAATVVAPLLPAPVSVLTTSSDQRSGCRRRGSGATVATRLHARLRGLGGELDLADDERGRRRAAHADVELGEHGALPIAAQHSEDHDVMQRVAVAMPAGEHAFAPEADALERELRAPVAGVRPCRQAVQPQVLERERGGQRLGLGGRAAPPPPAPHHT